MMLIFTALLLEVYNITTYHKQYLWTS